MKAGFEVVPTGMNFIVLWRFCGEVLGYKICPTKRRANSEAKRLARERADFLKGKRTGWSW